MATNKTNALEVLLRLYTKGGDKVKEELKGISLEQEKLNNLVDKTRKKREAANKATREAGRAIAENMRARAKATQDAVAKTKELRGALLGIGLTALFGGMAIKRFFGGLARGMINTFMIAQGETGAFSQGVARLQGAWEFLKYSIMDALAEAGTLDWIIGAMITLADTISTMSPETLAFIGKFIIGMVTVGTVMQIVGQAVLLMVGYLTLMSTSAGKAAAAMIKAFGAKTLSFVKNLGVALYDKVIMAMKWIAANPIKALTTGALITGLILVVAWIFKIKNAMGGWQEFGKSVIRGLLRMLGSFSAAVGATVTYMWSKLNGVSVDWKSLYNQEMSANLARINEDKYGSPTQGYAGKDMSIMDFIKGDLYNQNQEAMDYMNQGGSIGDTTNTTDNTNVNINVGTEMGQSNEEIAETIYNIFQNKMAFLQGSTG